MYFFHREFSLHKALALVEDEFLDVDSISHIWRPNKGDIIDEDSGDEDYVDTAHCMDMAVHNAWQIHKHNRGTIDYLSFRRSIANTLLLQNKKVLVHQRGPPSLSLNHELR